VGQDRQRDEKRGDGETAAAETAGHECEWKNGPPQVRLCLARVATQAPEEKLPAAERRGTRSGGAAERQGPADPWRGLCESTPPVLRSFAPAGVKVRGVYPPPDRAASE
jgi:hypothetical protein